MTFETPVIELSFSGTGREASSNGEATSIDGIISTRSGSGRNWESVIGITPIGEWEFVLPNNSDIKKRLTDGEIEDILFIFTYSGQTPAWPQ